MILRMGSSCFVLMCLCHQLLVNIVMYLTIFARVASLLTEHGGLTVVLCAGCRYIGFLNELTGLLEEI